MDKNERLEFIHDLKRHFEGERSFYLDKLEECKRIEGFEDIHDLLIKGEEMANRAVDLLIGAEAGVDNYDPKWEKAKELYGLR